MYSYFFLQYSVWPFVFSHWQLDVLQLSGLSELLLFLAHCCYYPTSFMCVSVSSLLIRILEILMEPLSLSFILYALLKFLPIL